MSTTLGHLSEVQNDSNYPLVGSPYGALNTITENLSWANPNEHNELILKVAAWMGWILLLVFSQIALLLLTMLVQLPLLPLPSCPLAI